MPQKQRYVLHFYGIFPECYIECRIIGIYFGERGFSFCIAGLIRGFGFIIDIS